MSELSGTIAFATQLYLTRARRAYAGYVRRDQLALLRLRPGQVDPYPIYERLRRGGGLAQTRRGSWVITSYPLCNSILRDRRFGVVQEGREVVAQNDGLDLSFLHKNPPEHGRLRRLAAPAFSRKAVAEYQPLLEKVTGELLDSVAGVERFNLIDSFAAQLPVAAMCALMGIPDADVAAVRRYAAAVSSSIDGIRSLRHAARLQTASVELGQLFGGLFELRRREPGDDLISGLVAAEGDRLTTAEMLSMCNLLLLAGFETTVSLIGNATLALLDNPEQWEALVADPAEMAGKAIEETLRYEAPIHLNPRFALEPAEVAGQLMNKDDQVTTLLGAANRDPEVYDRPDTFDITRSDPAPHLAFSSGMHYCLGQPLAVLEGIIALRMLAERMPGLTRAGKIRRHGNTIRNLVSLPVALPA
jgi:cytochrome P450